MKKTMHMLFVCTAIMTTFAVQAAPQLDENLRASLQSRVDSGEQSFVFVDDIADLKPLE